MLPGFSSVYATYYPLRPHSRYKNDRAPCEWGVTGPKGVIASGWASEASYARAAIYDVGIQLLSALPTWTATIHEFPSTWGVRLSCDRNDTTLSFESVGAIHVAFRDLFQRLKKPCHIIVCTPSKASKLLWGEDLNSPRTRNAIWHEIRGLANPHFVEVFCLSDDDARAKKEVGRLSPAHENPPPRK